MIAKLKSFVLRYVSPASIRSAVRTFCVSGAVIFVPGLLGWLNDVTSWAKGQGATPFPDAHGLAYLGVSAIVAGAIAVVDLLWHNVGAPATSPLIGKVKAAVTKPAAKSSTTADSAANNASN